jgi:hypothetical protein
MNSRENGAGFHKCGIKIAGTPKGSSAQTRDDNAGAHLLPDPVTAGILQGSGIVCGASILSFG